MSTRNIIQLTYDAFGRNNGFTKKSGHWYLRQVETIAAIELQKSQYGLQYYINVAVWLLPLGEAQYPKEWTCHVRTRLDDLLPDLEERLRILLDLEAPMPDTDRSNELMAVLTTKLLPLLKASSTVADLNSDDGQRLIKRSLVTGPAQRLLHGHPG